MEKFVALKEAEDLEYNLQQIIRATRGEGIMSHSFFEYRPMMGEFDARRNGVLIAPACAEWIEKELKNEINKL